MFLIVPAPAPPRSWLRPDEIVGVARGALSAYGQRHTGRIAAALAYYTLFSLFPILLLLLALIGFMLDAGWPVALGAQEFLLGTVEDLLPAAGDWVSNAIQSVQRGRGASGFIGLLGLLWSASSIFNQLHIALDQIWGVGIRGGLRFTVRRRALSIGIVLGLGLVLLTAQTVKSLTYWLGALSDRVPGGQMLDNLITWLLPFVVASVAFGLMYRTFPTTPISWQDVWPGAVLAGVGWEALKLVFAIYAANIANWQAVYGPVASVVGLLTWLYSSFVIILFGAEFSAAYSAQLRLIPETQEEPVAEALPVATAEPAPEALAQPVRRSRGGVRMAAGTIAGVVGGLATVGLGLGLLLRGRPGKSN